MSITEWLVVLIASAGGYWLVSFLMNGRSAEPPPRRDARREESSERLVSTHGQAWWDVLGASAEASPEEIREAYRSLIAQYHPDKVASLGPEIRELALRKSQQITEAYRTATQSQ